jgi:ubiquitin-conjugating enzyme E2 Z
MSIANKKSTKRISKDIKDIINNEVLREQDKIFCIFNDNDIYDVNALIVGPEDTPYQGGFFFFKLRFPDDYPRKPPTAKMQTLSSGVRFNPNLYEEGKVCLSILGTWQGPSWTVCMSMTTVLTSIQSLMSDMPYRNEPGHDKDSDILCHQYNDCVNYHNYRVAIVEMLKNPPELYKQFLPIMEKLFVKNYEKYMKRLLELKGKMQGKHVTAPNPFSNMSANCDYASLEVELINLYDKLSPNYIEEISKEMESKNVSEPDNKKLKSDSIKTLLFS